MRRFARETIAVVVAACLVLPLILDVNVLAAPGTAKYPGEDDYEFSAGWPSGTGLNVISDALERLAGPGQTIVAAVDFTPWNLAVRFSDPLRVPLGGPIPYQDAAVATAGSRKLYFYPWGTSVASRARFLLQNSAFATPAGLDLADWHLVASYRRPRGGVVQGHQQPLDTVELFERNG
jgi:hypothetical protein